MKKEVHAIACIITILVATFVFFQPNIPVLEGTTNNDQQSPFQKLLFPLKNHVKKTEPPDTPSQKIPILMYHYVEYVTDENDFIRDSLNIPPHIFERQLLTLKNSGYKFITPNMLPELFQNGNIYDGEYVIISFDDGYEDFYTDVLPILKKHNIKAINYIVYNFLGSLNYLNKEQVHEMVKSELVEIGSHTLTHQWLEKTDPAITYSEVYQSKRKIEEEFGIEILSFAYPYGAYDELTIKQVKYAGYTNAVTVETGNIVDPKRMFELKRIRPGHLVGEELIRYINDASN